MKPYFSIDIETTGDDSDVHQIIELAAIYEDPELQLSYDEIPKFQCFISHDNYVGNAYALALNQRIFKALSDESITAYPIESGVAYMMEFVKQHHTTDDQIRLTGKNIGSFDTQFLRKVGTYNFYKPLINYRTLEVGSFFFDPKKDDRVPNSDAVLKRAGINKSVTHEALKDAWDMICAIRTKY